MKKAMQYYLKNSFGKSTKEKIIVIESDDWGSIRMPSLKARERLIKKGVDLTAGDSARYNETDTLASAKDLEMLFEVLLSVKDEDGVSPAFTAMSLPANPDFEKIKESDFQKYYYEPFTKTLERYGLGDSYKVWKSGIGEKIFEPQFHGREHLNVAAWMRSLQNGDIHTRLGFEEGLWGFTNKGFNYQAAFDLELSTDLFLQEEILNSGLELFNTLHGRYPSFFVPPNGLINHKLFDDLSKKGVKYIGISKIQKVPKGNDKYSKSFNWLGKKNKNGQFFLTRNAFFEPNKPGTDWVASCIQDIGYAFSWKKPAVISTHRTNYIGGLNLSNREMGLYKLKELLSKIIKTWPDVKFSTSAEMAKRIIN